MKTFEANGRAWQTDEQTLNLMREYREAKNTYMVGVVFELGKQFGRVKEVAA